LQFVGGGKNGGMRCLELLRRKTDPVPGPRQWIYPGRFKMRSDPRLPYCTGKGGEIIHERLSTGDDSNRRPAGRDSLSNLIDRDNGISGGVPALLDIAPYTPHVAAAKSDKIGSLPLVGTFSLNGIKILHQGKHHQVFVGNRHIMTHDQFKDYAIRLLLMYSATATR